MIRASGLWKERLSDAGIDARSVFTDARVKVWRRLDSRENTVLELSGVPRLHIKRFLAPTQGPTPAEREADAIATLRAAGVGCLDLAAWGRLADGRSFVMTEDLGGYESCQEILRKGGRFADILSPTAQLAAKLHGAGLHHRDLYLCHFFFRASDGDCRLIDVGRVARLPRWFAGRWVVKDLSQFAYSTREFAVPEEEVGRWFAAYVEGGQDATALKSAAMRKADAIARHDARLRAREPDRNISITQRPPQ